MQLRRHSTERGSSQFELGSDHENHQRQPVRLLPAGRVELLGWLSRWRRCKLLLLGFGIAAANHHMQDESDGSGSESEFSHEDESESEQSESASESDYSNASDDSGSASFDEDESEGEDWDELERRAAKGTFWFSHQSDCTGGSPLSNS